MNIPKKEVLSARLADDVNKKLIPDEFHFSEFYFNEMVDIFKLPGMDQWPKTLETSLNKFLFSLVSFSSPNRKVCSKMTPSRRHQSAHKLSLEMLHHCFPEKKTVHQSRRRWTTFLPFLFLCLRKEIRNPVRPKSPASLTTNVQPV